MIITPGPPPGISGGATKLVRAHHSGGVDPK